MENINSKLTIELNEKGITISGAITPEELVNVTCHLMNITSEAISKQKGGNRESVLLSLFLAVAAEKDESILNGIEVVRLNA